MKKLLSLTLVVFLISFMAVPAVAGNITFQLDMSNWVKLGKFDPMTQEVRITGDLVDPNWNPAQAPVLTDEDGDLVYTVALDIADGDYQYKYLVGSDWGKDELQGQPNRSLTVAGDAVLDVVFFDNLDVITFAAAPDTMVNVHLAVNMTRQKQLGAFDPAADTVRVTGNLVEPNWSPAEAPIMEDPDGNLVYVKLIQVKKNTDYDYKYLLGSAWGRDELQGQDNRKLSIGEKDTVLMPVYFDNDPYVVPVGGDSVNVTLQLNMNVKIAEGTFDPATQVVRAAGSFQGWSPTTSPDMDDSDNDGIYVMTYKMTANTEHQYKFLIGTDWGQDEANNRSLMVGDQDMVVPPVYFNNDSVVTELKDGNIIFQVDMGVMNEIGIFDPAVDSVQVRGGFNGWNDGDPDRSKMEQDFLNENLWFLEVPFVKTGVGDVQLYKYYVAKADENTMWTDGWERPASQGGGNRDIEYLGLTNQTVDPDGDQTEYYDDIHPDWVIPAGTTGFEVTFQVDMTPAKDAGLQAVPFDPSKDTLYWVCEMPSFVFSQGWTDKNEMRVLKLTDDDGDDIFSGTLSVTAPSFNTFEYRYAWRNPDGWTFEPEGFGDFAYRVRYVGQDAARSFPTLPWVMPLDTWTNKENKSGDQEVDPFTSLTDIEDDASVPFAYSLNQNYPNPFNPTTTITYSLAEASEITLAVYNVLGQKVKTLVSGTYATAGTHVSRWNGLDEAGHKVASGVYFYKLEAGDYSAVKKMILMK